MNVNNANFGLLLISIMKSEVKLSDHGLLLKEAEHEL